MKTILILCVFFCGGLQGDRPVVGIICGHPMEANGVVSCFSDNSFVEEVGGRKYYIGKSSGVDVVLTGCFPGKVSAASAATCMIERYGVNLLLSVGTSGAVQRGLEKGDFVIGESVVQHDIDSRPFTPQYEIPLLKVARLHATEHLVEIAKKIAPAHVGLVATGDQFIDSVEKKRALQEAFPDLLVIDMESGAVAQVAKLYEKPFLAIKLVSSNCEPGSKEAVQAYVRDEFPCQMSGYLRQFLAAVVEE